MSKSVLSSSLNPLKKHHERLLRFEVKDDGHLKEWRRGVNSIYKEGGEVERAESTYGQSEYFRILSS